jgi:hypothetical protein
VAEFLRILEEYVDRRYGREQGAGSGEQAGRR